MQKRRTAMAAALCALVLFCAFVGSFLISSMSYQTDRYKVALPGEAGPSNELSETVVDEPRTERADLPDLTPQNVQAVIRALDRSEEYASEVTNTLYTAAGETASWSARTALKNGAQRIERLDALGSVSEIALYYEGQAYVWTPGSASFWSAAAGSLSADMAAMIPSYQDVCALPVTAITRTELMNLNGEPCIFVECGGEQEFLISCVSGLLREAKYYENGELVREVSILSSEAEVSETLFVLPGGEQPIYAQQ